MNLGERIQILRYGKKLTAAELANRLEKSESAIRMWESNNSKPDIDNLVKLAEIFGCSTDFLLGLTSLRSLQEVNYILNDFEEFTERFNNLPIEHKKDVIMVAEYVIGFYEEYADCSDIAYAYCDTVSHFEALLMLKAYVLKNLSDKQYDEDGLEGLASSIIYAFLSMDNDVLEVAKNFKFSLKDKMIVEVSQLIDKVNDEQKSQLKKIFNLE